MPPGSLGAPRGRFCRAVAPKPSTTSRARCSSSPRCCTASAGSRPGAPPRWTTRRSRRWRATPRRRRTTDARGPPWPRAPCRSTGVALRAGDAEVAPRHDAADVAALRALARDEANVVVRLRLVAEVDRDRAARRRQRRQAGRRLQRGADAQEALALARRRVDPAQGRAAARPARLLGEDAGRRSRSCRDGHLLGLAGVLRPDASCRRHVERERGPVDRNAAYHPRDVLPRREALRDIEA